MDTFKVITKSIENLTQKEKRLIDLFLLKSKTSTIFSTLEWQNILCRHFSRKIHLAIAIHDREIVALMFLEFEKKLGFMNYYYSPPRRVETLYGGPIICDYENKEKLVIQMFGCFKKFKNCYFNITFPPNYNLSFKNKECTISIGTTSIIDLNVSKQEIWNRLKKNCRGAINKARKSGVEVEIGGNEKLDIFYKLLKINYSRLPVDVKPLSFFKSIIDTFYPKNAKIFIAKYKGKNIGTAFLLHYKGRGYYWMGSNLNEYNNVNPGNIIQWKIIEYLVENKTDDYDMLNLSIPSIAKYKRSFGGQDAEFHTLIFRTGILSRLHKFKFFLQKNTKILNLQS